MEKNREMYTQIAQTLANHFDCLYLVDIETDEFFEYSAKGLYRELGIETEGDDFFGLSQKNAARCVFSEDVERVIQLHDKETMLKHLAKEGVYTDMYRLVINGKIVRMQHIEMMCEDNKHMIVCLENIEEQVKKEEERAENLQSARRMARRDELTGVRNKNAYKEFAESVDSNIKMGTEDYQVGVVVCDVNDLKVINDTRGHSFGDEAIQRSCHMICDAFAHSPVFRIGGDEFVAVLAGRDYEDRQKLLDKFRDETIANSRDRSGPVVACGMATYDAEFDMTYADVFERADKRMYEDKERLKTLRISDSVRNMKKKDERIPDDRKRRLDALFGALYTISGGGYVFLNDMRYDFSRWSLPLVDDFGMQSEYMYRAGEEWESHVHPDDIEAYRDVLEEVFVRGQMNRNLRYRAHDRNGEYHHIYNRGFVLTDATGEPEYFGGIMIPHR